MKITVHIDHIDRADRLATLAKTLDRALDDCWDRKAKALKAAIHRLSGYSAHADQQTLCDWVTSMPEPGEIRLVHGEPAAQKTLKFLLDRLF